MPKPSNAECPCRGQIAIRDPTPDRSADGSRDLIHRQHLSGAHKIESHGCVVSCTVMKATKQSCRPE